jgi:hypothetical protein
MERTSAESAAIREFNFFIGAPWRAGAQLKMFSSERQRTRSIWNSILHHPSNVRMSELNESYSRILSESTNGFGQRDGNLGTPISRLADGAHANREIGVPREDFALTLVYYDG